MSARGFVPLFFFLLYYALILALQPVGWFGRWYTRKVKDWHMCMCGHVYDDPVVSDQLHHEMTNRRKTPIIMIKLCVHMRIYVHKHRTGKKANQPTRHFTCAPSGDLVKRTTTG